jgi:hypothetical protein
MVGPNEYFIRFPSLKVQTDRLFACDAVLMGGRTYLPGLRCGVDGPVRRPDE